MVNLLILTYFHTTLSLLYLFAYLQVGFNFNIMGHFLKSAGFCQIERVQTFNVFSTSDTSELVYKGHFVSLNVVAKVCADNTPGGKTGAGEDE